MRVVGLPRQRLRRGLQDNRIRAQPQGPTSPKATLIWSVDNLKAEAVPITRATQALGLPRSTYYRWQKRLETEGPSGLAAGGGRRRPKVVRKPAWPAVKRLAA